MINFNISKNKQVIYDYFIPFKLINPYLPKWLIKLYKKKKENIFYNIFDLKKDYYKIIPFYKK
jgi:hypothetical protein